MSQDNIKLSPEIEQLSEKLQADPKSRVFAQLADAYRKVNLLDEAIDTAKKGLEVHPKYAIAHLVLGRCYLAKGMFALAREEFDLTIKNDPQNMVGYKLLGETYEKQNMYPDAIKYYQLVMDLEPGNTELAEKIERLKGLKQGEPPAEPEPAPLPAPSPESAPSDKEEIAVAAPTAESMDYPAPIAEDVMPEKAMSEPTEPAAPFEMPAMPEVLQEELPKPEVEVVPPAETAGQGGEPQISPASGEVPPASEPPVVPAADAMSPVAEPTAPAVAPAVIDESQGPTSTLAEIYVQQGYYEKAIDIYKELIAANPEDQEYKDRMEELIAKAYPDEPAEPPAPTGSVALPQQADEQKAPADAVLPGTDMEEPAPGREKGEPAPAEDPFAQMFAPVESDQAAPAPLPAPVDQASAAPAEPPAAVTAPEPASAGREAVPEPAPAAEPASAAPAEAPAVDFGALFTDSPASPQAPEAQTQSETKPQEQPPAGEDTVSSFQAWLSQIQK